ncbi:Hsp33-like chaperonin [Moritella sp. PE36]|uniref:Hsp33 family molecular chaperone HslO n=1 Tax=Moritella sp. PE36 TaxID=58051 RepID=UPI000156916F|nr:Hsp33 family molecular chaperone HslO [Moritella sp. PE36]EDM65591.1 Hsp33-like chaperonin [Moritella sp. PE36]
MSQKDLLHRYLFEDHQVRGEIVQLEQSFIDILENLNYPRPVQRLLGELQVATSLLTATLKFKGSITVQLQGDGPVTLAVINGNEDLELRGVARWNGSVPDTNNVKELIGKGVMVITISPDKGERYQGIVELGGDTLQECLEKYFEQSEQLTTRLWFRTGKVGYRKQAAGMMLQKLPASDDKKSSPEDFEHLVALTETIKDDELFNLDAEDVLVRLYHQEKVRLFDPQTVSFKCGCSHERSATALLSVAKEELLDIIAEKGQIEMHCDYCGSLYAFNAGDVEDIHAPQIGNPVH